MHGDPVIPPPKEDDDDDVAWALQTAAVQWDRGARSEAVVWITRAVDAAIAAGSATRIKELNRLVATVKELVDEKVASAGEGSSVAATDADGDEVGDFEEIDEIEVDEMPPSAASSALASGVSEPVAASVPRPTPPRPRPSGRPPPPRRARDGESSLAPSLKFPAPAPVPSDQSAAPRPVGAKESNGHEPAITPPSIEPPRARAPSGPDTDAIRRSLLSSEPPPPLADEDAVLPPAIVSTDTAPERRQPAFPPVEPEPAIVPGEAAPLSTRLHFEDDDEDEDTLSPIPAPAPVAQAPSPAAEPEVPPLDLAHAVETEALAPLEAPVAVPTEPGSLGIASAIEATLAASESAAAVPSAVEPVGEQRSFVEPATPATPQPAVERAPFPEPVTPATEPDAPVAPSGAAEHPPAKANEVFEDLASFASEMDSAADDEPFPIPVRPSQQPAPPPATAEPGAPAVDGVLMQNVRGFEDLPEEAQEALARTAVLGHLSVEEEVGAFAAALVTRGAVGIMPMMADVAGGVARAGDVVFTRGSLEDGVSLRVVALEDETVVASWKAEALDQAFADCPWVADELREVANRFQALAGATLGALGDRLDDSLRAIVTEKLAVRHLEPGDVIVEAGVTVPGLHVIGAGRIELVEGDAVVDELGPGDFIFAAEVMTAGPARATVRAGKGGALVLFASRATAHELMVSVPPLLEILAG